MDASLSDAVSCTILGRCMHKLDLMIITFLVYNTKQKCYDVGLLFLTDPYSLLNYDATN